MPRSLFPIIVSIILIAVSFFTAKMYSVGFRLSTVSTRLIFLFFLIIPLLFVGSIFFARGTGSVLAPVLYREIQILAGFGFYFFVGAILLAVLLLVGKLSGAHISVFISGAVLTLSLIAGVVGLVQSRFISVVDYTVTLADAPASWQGKTAVLVSDTHFGFINHARFSDKVVDRILTINPDFVLHAGDFYDGPRINTTPITQSWTRLTNTIPVYMAPGNHEEYGDYTGFITSLRDANVTVLDNKRIDVDGVTIAGITYYSGKDSPNATNAIESLRLNLPTILINHPPTSLMTAATNNVDLMVSGHTHNGQFWPMNYIVKSIYGAYTHGLARYEDMQVLTTSGVGTFGPPFRLFNPPELVRITFKTE